MFVHCFTVTESGLEPVSFEVLFKEFGENIPNYLQYEGGRIGFCTFLCCVDVAIDVSEICKKYGYDIGTLTKLDITNDTYSDAYTIYPTYHRSEDGLPFQLKPNEVYEVYSGNISVLKAHPSQESGLDEMA